MGFALPVFTSFLQPLRSFAMSMRPRATCPAPLAVRADAAPQRTAQADNDPRRTASPVHPCHTAAGWHGPRAGAAIALRPAPATARARPLRVIVNRHEDKACRLVISGRMADVCAELNRLALN